MRYILLLCFLSSALFGFSQISKKNNHIYIWDVTLSMKGYNGAPNIYDDVANVMIKSLGNIEEDGSDIFIIPFQDKVLQTYRQKATASGKQAAIDFVKGFKNENITYTNICIAWEKAITLLNNNEKNIVYLLTDGEQSDLGGKGYPKTCLNKVIDQYCALANNTENSYTFYISMTDKLSPTFKKKLRESCPEYLRFIEGTPPTNIISIQPTSTTQIVNLRENDLSFTQYFDVDGNLPETFKFNAILSTNGLNLPAGVNIKINNNQNRVIENGKSKFELSINSSDLQKLRKSAPEEMTATLFYSKQDLKKLGLEDHIIEFTPDRVNLKIRNKKEKTLKITLLDE